MADLAAPPIQDSVIELETEKASRRDPFYLAKTWITWLQDSLTLRVQQSGYVLKTVRLVNQSASIGATAVPIGSVTAGQYRVSYYARVTTPDGVASSLTVTLRWTEGSVALALSGSAMVGDTTTTVQSGMMLLEVDADSALAYATTYVSNTPGAMKYRLTVKVEAMPQ
jgi:hypothetical protein